VALTDAYAKVAGPNQGGTHAEPPAPAPVPSCLIIGLPAYLDDPAADSPIPGLLGTVATSPWISCDAYALALARLPGLRADPLFVDPDPVVVVHERSGAVIEVRRRLRPEGDMSSAVLAALGPASAISPDALAAAGIAPDAVRPPTDLHALTTGTASFAPPQPTLRQTEALPGSAVAALEVRELSGLSAEQLGALFPVRRENFQRWLAGARPSRANLERLLALRYFLRAAHDRIEDPATWLFQPLERLGPLTPYGLLERGRLSALWRELPRHPHAATSRLIDAEGSTGVLARGSLRSDERPTAPEELDDYGEWLDEN
jgi:hypothetical protein